MPGIKIDKKKCKGCQLCILYCPKGCIEVDGSVNNRGIYPVDFSKNGACTGCSLCAVICPDFCITVYR